MTWPLFGFLVFIALISLATGWLLQAAQDALDRQFKQDDEDMREAFRRWPP